MTSEKRSSYLNLAKLVGFFFFIYMKIISDSKMYINMSYSLFIFNIFLKRMGGGGHKIKSGHKEVWEGGGMGQFTKTCS